MVPPGRASGAGRPPARHRLLHPTFAKNLFEIWGIGVLILVSVREGGHDDMRLQLGGPFGHAYDQAMQRVIDEEMLPHFRAQRYSQGILAGTQATLDAITGENANPSPLDRLRDLLAAGGRGLRAALLAILVLLSDGSWFRYRFLSGGLLRNLTSLGLIDSQPDQLLSQIKLESLQLGHRHHQIEIGCLGVQLHDDPGKRLSGASPFGVDGSPLLFACPLQAFVAPLPGAQDRLASLFQLRADLLMQLDPLRGKPMLPHDTKGHQPLFVDQRLIFPVDRPPCSSQIIEQAPLLRLSYRSIDPTLNTVSVHSFPH
jgi:hypothetical protein